MTGLQIAWINEPKLNYPVPIINPIFSAFASGYLAWKKRWVGWFRDSWNLGANWGFNWGTGPSYQWDPPGGLLVWASCSTLPLCIRMGKTGRKGVIHLANVGKNLWCSWTREATWTKTAVLCFKKKCKKKKCRRSAEKVIFSFILGPWFITFRTKWWEIKTIGGITAKTTVKLLIFEEEKNITLKILNEENERTYLGLEWWKKNYFFE